MKTDSHIPSDEEILRLFSDLEESLPSEETPESQYEAKLLAEAIRRFSEGLPARQRYVFIGRFYFENSVRELAKELGTGTTTVNEDLRAIRSDLRNHLESEGMLT